MIDEEYEALKAEARRLRVSAKADPHDDEAWKAWTNAINALSAHALGIEHRGPKIIVDLPKMETKTEEASNE